MSSKPATVFISYSHRDESWKDRLVAHLRVLELEGALDVWDDRRIAGGDDWRPEIEQAIENAAVAILIVSKEFLTSKFIREQELTKILARRREGRLRVIPLIAEPCAWQTVAVLQGIQARPRDGRPLSAGVEYQVDANLTELAIEVLNGLEHRALSEPAISELSVQPAVTPIPRRARLSRTAWLPLAIGGSGVLAALLTLGATYWHLPTLVSLDLVTARVSFVVRGVRQVIDLGVKFDALRVEGCGTAAFEGMDFVVDPVFARSAGEALPEAATKFTCQDDAAKLGFTNRDGTPFARGALAAISLEAGTIIGIEIAGGVVPVLTLETSGHPVTLDLHLDQPVDVVAEFVELERTRGSAAANSGLVRYVGTLRDAPRHAVTLNTSDHGAAVVLELGEGSLPANLSSTVPTAAEGIQLDKEKLGGAAMTALLGEAVLSYVNYSKLPSRSIQKDEGVILERLTDAQLRGLRLETGGAAIEAATTPPAIRLTVQGNLERGVYGTSDPAHPERPRSGQWVDARLTLYDVMTYGRPRLAALTAAWTVATLWTAYLGWKKLSQ